MLITVIDNTKWDVNCITDGDFDKKSVDFIQSNENTFEDLYSLLEYSWQNGNRNFLINLHTIWLKSNKDKSPDIKYQQQGGVTVYRMLLKIADKHQQELKVVFFSPIINQTARDIIKEKELLYAKNPENYFLKFFKIIEVPFINWKSVLNCFSVEKYEGKHFNLASENLLSGWASNGKEKIVLGSKKIAFIDDQIEEWITTFQEIIDKPDNITFYKYNKSGTFQIGNICAYNTKNTFTYEYDLFLSDFYLEENHEIDKWLALEQLQTISGFQLFNKIKGKNAATPVIVHSSSNKIRYYDFFSKNGLNAWINKDLRLKAGKEEKKYNFIAFQNTIQKFTISDVAEIYPLLKILWKSIEKVENNATENWWFANKEAEQTMDNYIKKANKDTKKFIVNTLQESFQAIYNWYQRQDMLNADFQRKEESFVASAVCNNAYKIIEILEIEPNLQSDKGSMYNMNMSFFHAMRGNASHVYAAKSYIAKDAMLFLFYLLNTLNKTEDNIIKVFEPIIHKIKCRKCRIHYLGNGLNNLLYIHIQYYNSEYRIKEATWCNMLKTRIEELFYSIEKKSIINDFIKESDLKDAIFSNGNGIFNQSNSNAIELKFEKNIYKIQYVDSV